MRKMSVLAEELAFLKQEVSELKNEIRLLRRGGPRADVDSCEALLEHIHDEFGLKTWTAAQVFESAAENPPLLGAVRRCLAGTPNIYKLSVLLRRCLDQPWGDYRLKCVQDHTRDGRLFLVTGPVTPSQRNSDNVED